MSKIIGERGISLETNTICRMILKDVRYVLDKHLNLIFMDYSMMMITPIYLVTFIDDHSKKIWAYALKTKDQVFNVFK